MTSVRTFASLLTAGEGQVRDSHKQPMQRNSSATNLLSQPFRARAIVPVQEPDKPLAYMHVNGAEADVDRDSRATLQENPIHGRRSMLRSSPFNEGTRSEITAAGLNVVSAQPLYARAWRCSWL